MHESPGVRMTDHTDVKIVDPLSTDLVEVEGITLDLWKNSDSTFVPVLKKDMPLAQRTEAVREVTKQVTHMGDRLHAVLGEMLYEISKNKYWEDWTFTDELGDTRKFKSFEEYLESECEVSRRTAFYYISVYEKFVIELGIPAERMRDLEWSKAKEVTDIIDLDNWDDVLKKIGTMSVKAVRDYVRETKGISSPSSSTPEPDTFKRISFKLAPSQYENVEKALGIAESMTGSEKSGNQLDLICTGFVAEAPGMGLGSSLVKLDQIITSIERAFAVKLELTEASDERYKDLDGLDKSSESSTEETVKS